MYNWTAIDTSQYLEPFNFVHIKLWVCVTWYNLPEYKIEVLIFHNYTGNILTVCKWMILCSVDVWLVGWLLVGFMTYQPLQVI